MKKRYYILCALTLMLTMTVWAQDDNTVYTPDQLDEQPQFPGGQQAMQQYFQENMFKREAAAEQQMVGKLTLPYLLCGRTVFEVGEPVTILFQGKEETAYELKDLARQGSVYYVMDGDILLLKDADLVSQGGPVVKATAVAQVTIQVKGRCTLDAQGIAIQTAGRVVIEGEGAASSLTMEHSKQHLLQAGGDVTLRALVVKAFSSDYVLRSTGQMTRSATLTLEQVALQLTTKTGSVITGFRDVVATECGPSFDEYAAKKLLFNKESRVFQLLNRADIEEARSLTVSMQAPYITMDTRQTADVESWSIDDGQLVETSDLLVTLPYTVCGSEVYTIGRTATAQLDGQETTFYELLGAADRGAVCYHPESQTLMLDNAVIDHSNTSTYYIVQSTGSNSVPFTILVRGHNTLTVRSAAFMTGDNLTVTGEGAEQSTLDIKASTVMGSTPGYGLYAFKNMTLSDLTLNVSGFNCALYGNMASDSEPPTALTLRRVAGAMKCTFSIRPYAVGRFSGITLEGCGPEKAFHGGYPLTYGYGTGRQLMQDGQLCSELHLSTSDYMTITNQQSNE